jgi:predicted O-methyltransferase YrrM
MSVRSIVIRALCLNKVKRMFEEQRFRNSGGTRYGCRNYNVTLATALEGAAVVSDISDHLGPIFYFAMDRHPKLIVELGTRGGESTRALLAAAQESDATMLSLDIGDSGDLDLPYRKRWNFVQADDVAFGKERFTTWCGEHHLEPKAEVIFLDTSHEYEHTKQELEVWMPHLREGGVMILHDANMGNGLYGRLDGSIGWGWDNKRGVIRAVEEFFGRQYDEKTLFSDLVDGYQLLHLPYCNGLTVIKKRA